MAEEQTPRRTIVIAGLGMVALSFIEKVREYDTAHVYDIKVFSEEPHGNTGSSDLSAENLILNFT